MGKYVNAKKVNKKNDNGFVKFWSKFWNETKFLLTSLFSNQTCVDAKNKKWYFAVPLALVSAVLAVIPIGSSQWKQTGATILSSPTYSLENGLIAFQESLEDNNLSVKVNAIDGTLDVDETLWNQTYETTNKAFSYIYTKNVTKLSVDTTTNEDGTTSTSIGNAITTTVNCCDLTVYYYSDSVNFDALVSETLSGSDVLGNTTYSVNTLFLGKKKFVLCKKPAGASSIQGKLTGYYDKYSFDFKNLTKEDSHGNAYSVTRSQVTTGNKLKYIQDSLSAWQTFFSDAYDNQRIIVGWQTSGIWLGIYIGVIATMGFLIWLLTRGKNNPYRTFNLWETQKIAYWASLCPALLTLILGFMMPQFLQMYFIFLYGFRVMWMSMKTLRPYQQ